MSAIVEMSDCLRDSPKFRRAIQVNEDSIDQLEVRLEKVLRLSSSMVDAGKAYLKTKSTFVSSLYELMESVGDDPVTVNTLNRMAVSLSELNNYHSTLLDHTQRAVFRNLSLFLRQDLAKVKDTKKHFDKVSDDLDMALSKHSAASKYKPHDCEEASNLLSATRSLFQHTALEYVNQISCLQLNKRHEILDALLNLMLAYGTYFHQGQDLFSHDLDSFMKHASDMLVKMREESSALNKQLERSHACVAKDDIVPVLVKGDRVRLEGYLNKRTSNAFKTWNRRWFIIQEHQLVYQKRSHDAELTVMEEDLRLCTAKPFNDSERRFCFEILSPSKSHILQADSEEACKQWLAAMQAGIDAAYNDQTNHPNCDGSNVSIDSQDSNLTTSSSSTSKSNCNYQSTSESFNGSTVVGGVSPSRQPQRVPSQILSVVGNELCCDCRAPDPKWASINLGVTLCIECSGIHRSLGVHMSKVRSLMLDAWDNETIKVMLELGNVKVNEIYEKHLEPGNSIRISHNSQRREREAFIKAKYISKSFVEKIAALEGSPKPDTISSCSKTSVSSSAILSGELIDKSSSNLSNCDTSDAQTVNPTSNSICDNCIDPNNMLYVGASRCDLILMVQALANGAQVNWINEKDSGMTSLHQAVLKGSLLMSEFLLLNCAKPNIQDALGRTPLHLATENGHIGLVCQLLKRGHCNQDIQDKQGRTALDIAKKIEHADIVTLLKVAKLTEEMKNDEFCSQNDEIFKQVVDDFSQKHLSSTQENDVS